MTLPTPSTADGLLDTEPVAAFLAALAGIVDLGLVAASALDWVALTDGQTAAIVAFVSGVTAGVAAFLRSRVWSPATVSQLTGGPI